MFKPSRKKKSKIDIIPLIDVIFFLLVFFMLFTSFQSNPFGLEMQLPEAVTATEQASDNIVVHITEEGQFYLNDEQMALGDIRDTLSEDYNEDELSVIINADSNARYEYVIQVMDNLRQVGIYNIFLSAEQRPEDND